MPCPPARRTPRAVSSRGGIERWDAPSTIPDMILKDRDERPARDRLEAAGFKAERQLAHYLKRAFGDSKDVFVFNDLRVVRDSEVAQIDHLLLHRSGMVIIESKSVTSEISVNRQGEFVRTFQGRRAGMPSPIEQARRQAELLRRLLDDHAASLLPRSLGVLQQRFGAFPIDVLVAISDQGIITHQGTRPSELLKADAIPERLQAIVTRHARARGITGLLRQALADDKKAFDGAGDFNLKAEDAERIANFLLTRHEEPGPPATSKPVPPIRGPVTATNEPRRTSMTTTSDEDAGPRGIPGSRDQPACKHCGAGGQELQIEYGRYGYYFRCRSCDQATGIDLTCECRPRQRGKVRKSGPSFRFECANCGASQIFFENA